MKLVKIALVLLMLMGCSHQTGTGENETSSTTIITKKEEIDNAIEYDNNNLQLYVLSEQSKKAYYKSDFIPFIKENEAVLKEIGTNIVDLSLKNEYYYDFNYDEEQFKYYAYFILNENIEFDEILVNFFGNTFSGYYRIRFDFDCYSVYYYSFGGALFTDDLNDGDEVIMTFRDGDSTSYIYFIRQNDYLIKKEE